MTVSFGACMMLAVHRNCWEGLCGLFICFALLVMFLRFFVDQFMCFLKGFMTLLPVLF